MRCDFVPPLGRRAVFAAAVAALSSSVTTPLSSSASDLGLSRGSLRGCPASSPVASGCVSSSPTAAPNQFMAPLRYEGDLEIAFKRVRAELSSDPGFRLLEAASPDYLLASSEDGDLELHFLQPEDGFGYVTFRMLMPNPSVMPAFCGQRGCINGNNAQRTRVEKLREACGWRAADASFETEKFEGWVPIFLH